MNSLCTPRRIIRARLEKASTVRVRSNKAHRTGISAAILKINGKWRQRKSKALQKLKRTEWYKQLIQLSPQSCTNHLQMMSNDFDDLQEKEVEFVRENLMHLPNLSLDDCNGTFLLPLE